MPKRTRDRSAGGSRRGALCAAVAAALLLAALFLLYRRGLLPFLEPPYYTAGQLGIKEVHSTLDCDGDGVEDYADMILGIRAYFETGPHYKSAYYAGGYPDDGCGVCTDVVWHGFEAAGYDLKSLVDEDIAAAPDAYTHISHPDPNIDFRRVRTLNIFFARHALALTTDLDDPEQWQAGDIVIFGASEHIGICSDRRDRRGIPLLLHHGNPVDEAVERDDIPGKTVTAHYRWPG